MNVTRVRGGVGVGPNPSPGRSIGIGCRIQALKQTGVLVFDPDVGLGGRFLLVLVGIFMNKYRNYLTVPWKKKKKEKRKNSQQVTLIRAAKFLMMLQKCFTDVSSRQEAQSQLH